MPDRTHFKKGDIVRLKSGGPRMTVKYTDTSLGELLCQWFASSKLHVGYFDPATVEPAERVEEED